MMLTIHGFPLNIKYQDVKLLIKGQCNICDFILDNLIGDSEGTKKVRVGLTDNAEGYKLMKCLNGYRMSGTHVLKVVPVGKAAPTPPQPNSFDARSGYSNPQRNEFSNQPRNDYMNMNQSNDYGNKGVHGHPGSHGSGPHGPGSHGPGSHSSSGPVAPGGSRYKGQAYGSGPSYGQGPAGPARGPNQPNFQENMGRPSPWVSGSSNTNQWNDNQPMNAQIPQNTFSYNSQPQSMNSSYVPQQHLQNQGPSQPEVRNFNQDRPAPGQSGFPPKNNAPPVLTNSRYRWNKFAQPEPKPEPGETNEQEEKRPPKPKETNIHVLRKKFAEGRLSGSAHRRVAKWMKLGKSFKEALALCTTRLKDVPEYLANKKAKQLERTQKALNEPMVPVPPFKPAEWKAPKPPPGTSKALKISIMEVSGPMTQEHADSIQKTILERINLDDGDGPRFLGCFLRHGGLQLSCGNMKSKEWLLEQLPTIKPFEGAELVAVDQKRRMIGLSFIPDSDIKEDALINLLKTQNKGMDFSYWSVARRKPEKSGQMVTFSFDDSALQPLTDRNFYLFLGLGKIQIRTKKKSVDMANKREEQVKALHGWKTEPGTSEQPAVSQPKKKKQNQPVANNSGRGGGGGRGGGKGRGGGNGRGGTSGNGGASGRGGGNGRGGGASRGSASGHGGGRGGGSGRGGASNRGGGGGDGRRGGGGRGRGGGGQQQLSRKQRRAAMWAIAQDLN